MPHITRRKGLPEVAGEARHDHKMRMDVKVSGLRILQEFIALVLRATMLPIIVREVFQRRKVTIILYHKISASLFERHLNYLSTRYSIISLGEFIKARAERDMKKLPAKPIVITFDDGAKVNYTLKQVIQQYKVPVTMFLCSDMVGTNHNAGALSKAEVADLIRIGVSIQSHTLTHPILPMCDDLKAETEIAKSKTDLERKFGIKVDYFAYPNGDYCPRDVNICQEAGYLAGVTVDLGFNDMDTDVYRLKRICIFDNASVSQLIVRASGVWGFVKQALKL